MLKTIYATATAGLFLALAAGAAADPWKDESGNGRQGYERYYESYTEAKEGKIERSENGCKIEEIFDGGYKKEAKCDGRSARIGSGLPHSYGPPVNLVPEEMTTWRDPDGSGQSAGRNPDRIAGKDTAQIGPCREYNTIATVNGEQQQTYGRACRQPDGSWKIIQ